VATAISCLVFVDNAPSAKTRLLKFVNASWTSGASFWRLARRPEVGWGKISVDTMILLVSLSHIDRQRALRSKRPPLRKIALRRHCKDAPGSQKVPDFSLAPASCVVSDEYRWQASERPIDQGVDQPGNGTGCRAQGGCGSTAGRFTRKCSD